MASRNPSRSYDTLPRSTNASNLPSVRRNLFSSHPRRPAATSSLSTATSTTSQTVHSDESASTKEDIIIRDEAGDFRLELPCQTPLPMREDQKEEQGAENRLIEQYYTHRHQIDVNGPSTISYSIPSPFSHKRQRTLSDEGTRDIQAHRRNEMCVACGWPAHKTKQDWENAADCSLALQQTLQQNLHNSLVSLEEDKWMFGEEDGPAS